MLHTALKGHTPLTLLLIAAAAAAALLALVIARRAGRRTVRRAASGAVLCCILVLATGLAVLPVGSDEPRTAGDARYEAASRALTTAFGDRYGIVDVRQEPGSGELTITLNTGVATLSWPDAENFNISLERTAEPGPDSFPVAGDGTPPASPDDAVAAAERYAGTHYPWALNETTRTVDAVGDGAQFGWLVSWRSVVDGVLMPLRLDVQINRAGRVSQLNVQQNPPPGSLPPHWSPGPAPTEGPRGAADPGAVHHRQGPAPRRRTARRPLAGGVDGGPLLSRRRCRGGRGRDHRRRDRRQRHVGRSRRERRRRGHLTGGPACT
ncbi:hypothetical protein [Kitasatospora camelliae]|uniref:Uncharacterized protein n=1 Tax=Kitasatospora camelliae TaxID=3156397 RepID=A0AAU8K6G0_9ACTN